jgi:nucleoside phosphorylase/CheY-like chemotaxis protein
LKILLVDDDEDKSQAIISSLGDLSAQNHIYTVTRVKTLADAMRTLGVVTFDLIILDLMLPYLSGGQTDSRAGLELLVQLRSKGGLNSTTPVIGISAFPAEVAAYRSRFDELAVVMAQYDDQGSWRRTLQNVLTGIISRGTTRIDLDFVIICALEEERAGFEDTGLEKVSEAIVSGLNLHYVRLVGPRVMFGAIVRLGQMGLVAATFETASVLNTFRVRILSMSGICAGFSEEAELGQIIVASIAWEYQAGKWSKDGFEIAPLQVQLRRSTRAAIDQLIARDSFLQYLEKSPRPGQRRPAHQPRAQLAPVATGSAVIADVRRLEHIQIQHRKVAGLDMETFGLYFVAHESAPTLDHFFSVKCVVDFADADKGDDLHPYGCMASARATEQILRTLLSVPSQAE